MMVARIHCSTELRWNKRTAGPGLGFTMHADYVQTTSWQETVAWERGNGWEAGSTVSSLLKPVHGPRVRIRVFGSRMGFGWKGGRARKRRQKLSGGTESSVIRSS